MPVSESQIRSPATPAEWDQYFDLRWRVLREPWNQPRGSEHDDREDSAHHAAIFEGHTVVAVGRLHQASRDVGQIRYMAVAPDQIRSGLGSKILQHLEAKAQDRHYTAIELDARESALYFYHHHGYERISSSPTKWGIPHHRMRKLLQSDGTFTVP